MGLLDEAIREHLDLKRRRGADPAEIERAEREALGPVRRPPAPSSDEHSGGVASEEAEAVGGSETAEVAKPDREAVPQPEREVFPEPEREVVPEPGVQAEAVERPEYDEPADIAESIGVPPAPPPTGPETAEYDVEREHAESTESEAGDEILEETPDFLQDTPDHDRLWFEQRPPRDFDFEG